MEKKNKTKSAFKKPSNLFRRNSKGSLVLQKFLNNLQEQESDCVTENKQITQCVFLGALRLKPVPDIFQVTLQPICFKTKSNTSLLYNKIVHNNIDKTDRAVNNTNTPVEVKRHPRKNTKKLSPIKSNHFIGNDQKPRNRILELFNNKNIATEEKVPVKSLPKLTLNLSDKNKFKYKMKVGGILDKNTKDLENKVEKLTPKKKSDKKHHYSINPVSAKTPVKMKSTKDKTSPKNKELKSITIGEKKNVKSEHMRRNYTVENTVLPLKIKITNKCKSESNSSEPDITKLKKNCSKEVKKLKSMEANARPVAMKSGNSYISEKETKLNRESIVTIDLEGPIIKNEIIDNVVEQKPIFKNIPKVEEPLHLADVDDDDEIEDYLEIDQNIVADLDALIPDEEIESLIQPIIPLPDILLQNIGVISEPALTNSMIIVDPVDSMKSKNCDKIVDTGKLKDVIKIDDIKKDVEIEKVVEIELLDENEIISDTSNNNEVEKRFNKSVEIVGIIDDAKAELKSVEKCFEKDITANENKISKQKSDETIPVLKKGKIIENAQEESKEATTKQKKHFSKAETKIPRLGKAKGKMKLLTNIRKITDFLSPDRIKPNEKGAENKSQNDVAKDVEKVKILEIPQASLDSASIVNMGKEERKSCIVQTTEKPSEVLSSDGNVKILLGSRLLRSGFKQPSSGSDVIKTKKNDLPQLLPVKSTTSNKKEESISNQLNPVSKGENKTGNKIGDLILNIENAQTSTSEETGDMKVSGETENYKSLVKYQQFGNLDLESLSTTENETVTPIDQQKDNMKIEELPIQKIVLKDLNIENKIEKVNTTKIATTDIAIKIESNATHNKTTINELGDHTLVDKKILKKQIDSEEVDLVLPKTRLRSGESQKPAFLKQNIVKKMHMEVRTKNAGVDLDKQTSAKNATQPKLKKRKPGNKLEKKFCQSKLQKASSILIGILKTIQSTDKPGKIKTRKINKAEEKHKKVLNTKKQNVIKNKIEKQKVLKKMLIKKSVTKVKKINSRKTLNKNSKVELTVDKVLNETNELKQQISSSSSGEQILLEVEPQSESKDQERLTKPKRKLESQGTSETKIKKIKGDNGSKKQQTNKQSLSKHFEFDTLDIKSNISGQREETKIDDECQIPITNKPQNTLQIEDQTEQQKVVESSQTLGANSKQKFSQKLQVKKNQTDILVNSPESATANNSGLDSSKNKQILLQDESCNEVNCEEVLTKSKRKLESQYSSEDKNTKKKCSERLKNKNKVEEISKEKDETDMNILSKSFAYNNQTCTENKDNGIFVSPEIISEVKPPKDKCDEVTIECDLTKAIISHENINHSESVSINNDFQVEEGIKIEEAVATDEKNNFILQKSKRKTKLKNSLADDGVDKKATKRGKNKNKTDKINNKNKSNVMVTPLHDNECGLVEIPGSIILERNNYENKEVQIVKYDTEEPSLTCIINSQKYRTLNNNESKTVGSVNDHENLSEEVPTKRTTKLENLSVDGGVDKKVAKRRKNKSKIDIINKNKSNVMVTSSRDDLVEIPGSIILEKNNYENKEVQIVKYDPEEPSATGIINSQKIPTLNNNESKTMEGVNDQENLLEEVPSITNFILQKSNSSVDGGVDKKVAKRRKNKNKIEKINNKNKSIVMVTPTPYNGSGLVQMQGSIDLERNNYENKDMQIVKYDTKEPSTTCIINSQKCPTLNSNESKTNEGVDNHESLSEEVPSITNKNQEQPSQPKKKKQQNKSHDKPTNKKNSTKDRIKKQVIKEIINEKDVTPKLNTEDNKEENNYPISDPFKGFQTTGSDLSQEMVQQMQRELSREYGASESGTYRRIHSCRVCLRVFRTYSKLKIHKGEHDVKNPYQCQECGKSYDDVEELAAHLRIHKGKMPYPCKKCDSSFWTNVQLERHELVHILKKAPPPNNSTPKKIFKCEVCAKEFKKICDLERHTRVHTGEKPSVCNICNKRFQQAYNLNKHLLIHTQEKNFECVICQKKFGRNDVLNRHVLTHSIYKPFHCPICSKTFIRNTQLNLHLRKHHKMKEEWVAAQQEAADDPTAGKSSD